MKTLLLIECRHCGGSYYAGEQKLILNPGTTTELPDELNIVVRKVPRCLTCKQQADRTIGSKKSTIYPTRRGFFRK